jgi:hypothetical protein
VDLVEQEDMVTLLGLVVPVATPVVAAMAVAQPLQEVPVVAVVPVAEDRRIVMHITGRKLEMEEAAQESMVLEQVVPVVDLTMAPPHGQVFLVA